MLNGEKLLTVPEVATSLRVSKMTIYRLVETRQLVGIRIGRSIRIPEGSVAAYLRASIEP